jgi:hypothetical protein
MAGAEGGEGGLEFNERLDQNVGVPPVGWAGAKVHACRPLAPLPAEGCQAEALDATAESLASQDFKRARDTSLMEFPDRSIYTNLALCGE